MREETDRKEIISLLRDRRVREEIDRGEIISLLRDLKTGTDCLIKLLDGMASRSDTSAAAADTDQKAKEQIELTRELIDEWKNGGEGDRWENL